MNIIDHIMDSLLVNYSLFTAFPPSPKCFRRILIYVIFCLKPGQLRQISARACIFLILLVFCFLLWVDSSPDNDSLYLRRVIISSFWKQIITDQTVAFFGTLGANADCKPSTILLVRATLVALLSSDILQRES